MLRRRSFTPPVWCEFSGFSHYNFYSELLSFTFISCLIFFGNGFLQSVQVGMITFHG